MLGDRIVSVRTADAPPTVVTTADDQATPLLRVRDLRVWFPVRRGILRRTSGWIRAVDGIDFDVRRGTTLALVGESGSGKTTTARAVVRVERLRTGSIQLDGVELSTLKGKRLRAIRQHMQMVFQDPFSSLDPRKRVDAIVSEPMRVHHVGGDRHERKARVRELLAMVGLDPAFSTRFPHEFSGGQRQRIGIARAIAVSPDLIVCDEPVSSLDVSIQAQVINLLKHLQRDLGLTYLFIAHDLAVVRHVADDVAVMYLGRLVERGPADAVYAQPRHPYTKALLSAAPIPDTAVERSRVRIILRGDVPSPEHPPPGCRFHTRCWLRENLGDPARCVEEEPELRLTDTGASAACHFSEQLRQGEEALGPSADVSGQAG